MYQQGNFTLTEGQKDYTVNFSTQFPVSAPSLILTDIFNSDEEDPQDYLEGSVISRTTNGFSFSLITAPDNGNYVLSWMASDGLGNTPVTSSGIPVTDLPIFNGTSLPENTIFPAVVSNGANKSVAVRWNKMKTLIAASHQHNVSDLSDAGVIGINLIQASTQEQARSAIAAANTEHTHLSEDITDSSELGRSIIAAGDESEARTLIDAAPTTHTHTAEQIGASAIGLNLITAASQAAARSAIGAVGESHNHVPDDITGATSIGKSVLTASNESNARAAILAANKTGWENNRTLVSSRNIDNLDFGCKFIVENTLTYTILTGISNLGKIGFYVAVEGSLTIEISLGVTIKDVNDNTITNLNNLPIGFYVLENIGLNNFFLSGYTNSVPISIDVSAINTLPPFTAEDISTISNISFRGVRPTIAGSAIAIPALYGMNAEYQIDGVELISIRHSGNTSFSLENISSDGSIDVTIDIGVSPFPIGEEKWIMSGIRITRISSGWECSTILNGVIGTASPVTDISDIISVTFNGVTNIMSVFEGAAPSTLLATTTLQEFAEPLFSRIFISGPTTGNTSFSLSFSGRTNGYGNSLPVSLVNSDGDNISFIANIT